LLATNAREISLLFGIISILFGILVIWKPRILAHLLGIYLIVAGLIAIVGIV
jgi:uncharacterized membrane protein HdeD (DUF308 family)